MPRGVALAFVVATAFFHGGLWFQEDLARPYCARCRRLVAGVVAAGALLILSAAAVGVAVWLHGRDRI